MWKLMHVCSVLQTWFSLSDNKVAFDLLSWKLEPCCSSTVPFLLSTSRGHPAPEVATLCLYSWSKTRFKPHSHTTPHSLRVTDETTNWRDSHQTWVFTVPVSVCFHGDAWWIQRGCSCGQLRSHLSASLLGRCGGGGGVRRSVFFSLQVVIKPSFLLHKKMSGMCSPVLLLVLLGRTTHFSPGLSFLQFFPIRYLHHQWRQDIVLPASNIFWEFWCFQTVLFKIVSSLKKSPSLSIPLKRKLQLWGTRLWKKKGSLVFNIQLIQVGLCVFNSKHTLKLAGNCSLLECVY